MSSKPSEHDEIIAEAREKYTVHNCGQCEFRKSCYNEFDSDECKESRQSIMLGFGIEDGYFTKLLDRLEAAHEREVEMSHATSEKSSQVGNNAKIREALSDACYAMFNFLKTQNGGFEEMAKALDKAKATLATPPRNCDVGTAEEQEIRFKKFCNSHYNINNVDGECNACPLNENIKTECEFAWAQMPYKEREEK